MVISSSKKSINLVLASPRGFCAGVDRAITIVEKALEMYGSPIYVQHEIVHMTFEKIFAFLCLPSPESQTPIGLHCMYLSRDISAMFLK